MLYPQVNFNPLKDLAAVATAVEWSHVLVVAPTIPARTIAELVAYARENPGKLNFGPDGSSEPRLTSWARHSTSRRPARQLTLPYSSRTAVVNKLERDLLGGRVHMNFGTVGGLLPLIQEAKLRPLAVTRPRNEATALCPGCLRRWPSLGSHR